jgi:beta-galactosidase
MFGSESYSASAFDYWQPTETMPWVIGDFVWTAFDYLGEASIGWTGYSPDWRGLGPYPWQLAYCGEIDATGRRRAASYYRQIMWGAGDTKVAAFVAWPGAGGALPDRDFFGAKGNRQWVLPDVHPSWSWPGYEGKPLDVVVYSRGSEVELTLNGKSLGRKPIGAQTRYEAHFQVPYAPGVLRATGYRNGRKIGEWTLETAGKPARIRLSVDRPSIAGDGLDLAYVVAELVDAQGRPIYDPADDRLLSFDVAGAGTLAGLGNGNPVSTESFFAGARKTFNGRVVGVIRGNQSKGPITVKVSGEGFPEATASLQAGL